MRTRIKICGLTRPADVDEAVRAGADAIGLVFYPPSPRFVTLERAAELAARVPPFVSVVGLFVNAERTFVETACAAARLQTLQFHGDEAPADCRGFGRPYIKAARVKPGVDLVEFAARFADACGILLDAHSEAYGGSGQCFDWSLIPSELPLPLILSGGLNAENVAGAVARYRPWAVDVSSGVEAAKGIKDGAKIAAFIAGVKDGEARSSV
ncbi:MAG: phosphoribosylanthranilate isomerase [Rhodocyclaceae bacterium]|nr:phosphoribosylanthranilate isomerase [Rhodocyclaceae bacterium]MBX3666919.1 phosphoribosylanthranilate isomerase [Rhodocyclaceae bacterium]